MKILNGITLTGIATIQTNSLAVGTTQLVTANTNVGIGVTNPISKLEVAGQTFTMILAAGQSSSLIYNDSSVIYANDFYPYKLNYAAVNSVGLHNRIIKNLNGTDDEHVSLLNEVQAQSTADSPGEAIVALQNSIQPKNNVGTIGTLTALNTNIATFESTGATITTMRGAFVNVNHNSGTYSGATSYNTTLITIVANGSVTAAAGATSKVITDTLSGSAATITVANFSTYSSAGASVGNASAVRGNVNINGATVGSISAISSLLQIDTGSGQTNTNITNLAGISLTNSFGKTSPTYATNITNYYGLYMSGSSIGSNVNITNKYGIYQTDTTFPNYFGSNVGIGTTTPNSPLHVNGIITLTGSAGSPSGNQSYVFQNSSTTEDYGLSLRHYKSSIKDAEITIGGSFNNGVISFLTNTAGATATERMVITAGGGVGIGTVSPADKLHLEGNLYLGTSSRTIYTAGSGNLVFQTNTGAMIFLRNAAANESMRISAGGSLGIGTQSPIAKLDVAGEIRTSDKFGYGASAYTQYNATTKSIDFIFA